MKKIDERTRMEMTRIRDDEKMAERWSEIWDIDEGGYTMCKRRTKEAWLG